MIKQTNGKQPVFTHGTNGIHLIFAMPIVFAITTLPYGGIAVSPDPVFAYATFVEEHQRPVALAEADLETPKAIAFDRAGLRMFQCRFF